MKKDLIIAATWINLRVGYLDRAWELQSKLLNGVIDLGEAMEPIAQRAVDAMEIAESIAMSKPDGYKHSIYYEIGDDLGRLIKAEKRMWTTEEAHNVITNVVFNVFTSLSLVNHTQAEILKKKLAELGEDDDEE